jgi:DDE superfamily endonuclease
MEEVASSPETSSGPSSIDSSSIDEPLNLVILTEDEMLYKGLVALQWPIEKLGRRSLESNIEQYHGMYGLDPSATAKLWLDLQTTKIEDALVIADATSIDKLHWALHFLYRYPTESERESIWKKSANTIRESCWFFVYKIKSLRAEKIVWPKFMESDTWVMSVDGTHLVTLEPGQSPDFPRDPSYFSFKHHTAGFNYEVGIHLFESKCIWLSGPHKAGEYNDAKIFREHGLMHRLRQKGKKAIADDGYRGFPGEISTHNSLDTDEVREFKTRARQRHEIYNGMLKQFDVLSDRFRCKNHPKDPFTVAEKLQFCFEAVNILVNYKMQTEPLFDI